MSFQQALSGLNAAAKNLDVIGNNVANSNTVGFKGGRAEFADVYASTLSSSTAGAIGIGTKVSAVTQSFTQGSISTTNNPYDVAISGEGFFRMDNNGSVVYSRNGQFHRDSEGYLVNANGLKLTGYVTNANGQIVTAQPQPLQLTVNSIEAKPTGSATQSVILDSRKPAIADNLSFDVDNSDTFTHSTSMSVYDSLGNSHLLSSYYRKTEAGQWDVYTSFDGGEATKLSTLNFNSSGQLVLSDDNANQIIPTITIPADSLSTGAADLVFKFDMSKTTQTGQAFSNEVQLQDGYTSGRLTSFSIDETGALLANYSNQQARMQGQIVLASFNNPQGLMSTGGNNFVETLDSGSPRLGSPDSSNFGSVRSGALEDANIDLTAELVNMITAQRVYQANAQTIKTQDSIMQTIVNLR